MNSLVDLSEDQGRVYDSAKRFLRQPFPERPYFVYKGQAGTGKTEVLARLAREYPDSIMCAFAGKSASVLRARTGLDVATIHSTIFDFKGTTTDEWTGEEQPIFTSKEADFSGRLIFLDECGTVGMRLGEELLATGARIIACGDPHQLRPVRDKRFFEDSDMQLTEIHRQAWDSPIIRQATSVKNGDGYEEDTEDFRVIHKADITRDDLGFGGIGLCWRNATRQRMNFSRRRVLGMGEGHTISPGEPIMVLRNDYAQKVFNGEIYKVTMARSEGGDLQVSTLDDSREMVLYNVACEGIDANFDEARNDRDWMPVALAYSTTVHKFIGSEEIDVMVVDEYEGLEKLEWQYTAFTRAKKRVLVVRT